MHCGQHGHWFLSGVHAGENSCRLRNPGQALVDHRSGEVFEVQVKVVLVRTASPAFPYLDGHRSADHVSRSEEHTSELQSLMRISYAVFCLKKKTHELDTNNSNTIVNQLHDT